MLIMMVYHCAKIVQKYMASPTVAVLQLHVPALTSFGPGQWVDFVVEPHDWIGGFSIASSPRDLPHITIAVKRSNHPPARWVHDRLAVNDSVKVSVGGTCTLEEMDPTTTKANTTLPQVRQTNPPPFYNIFCAGGIGISPILSQYREFLHRRRENHQNGGRDDEKKYPSMFLYSVSTPDELVFGDELTELSQPGCEAGIDKMVFTVTKNCDGWREGGSDPNSVARRKNEGPTKNDHVEFRTGRVLTEFLNEAPIDNCTFYICGPASMIDFSVEHLQNRGVPSERIKYEKWW
jgi:ferredoxin-NADP reductase